MTICVKKMGIVQSLNKRRRGARVKFHHLAVCVPQNFETLEKAVTHVHEHGEFSTVLIGKGIHEITGDYLKIPSTMNIVGDPRVPKSEIVVVGGIHFERGIQGICHVRHLILTHANVNGVVAYSSFAMDDVVVQNCKRNGVECRGVVGTCTNVKVQECRTGMAVIGGGSITLVGIDTVVRDNGTGLSVYGASYSMRSVIRVVRPLTRELVFNNGQNFSTNSTDIVEIEPIAPLMF